MAQNGVTMGAPLPSLSLERFSRRLAAAVEEPLAPEAAEKLFSHYEELRRWNARLPLIGPGTTDRAVEVHYAESLAGRSLIGARDRVLVDLGSGAGFPGAPLAAGLPDLEVWLVEPRSRKWAFLRSAVAAADLRCRCLDTRLTGDLPTDFPSAIDVVTVRALKLEPEIWQAIGQRLSRRGRILSWGVEEAPEELAGWRVGRRVRLPGRERWILELKVPA